MTFLRQNVGRYKNFSVLKPFWVVIYQLFPHKKSEGALIRINTVVVYVIKKNASSTAVVKISNKF